MGHMFGIQRPVPRAHALHKIGDDAVGDAAVNIGAGFRHSVLSFGLAKQRCCFLPVGESKGLFMGRLLLG